MNRRRLVTALPAAALAVAAVTAVASARDSAGRLLWASRYDGAAGFVLAQGVAVSPDGSKVFAAGSSSTIAYDAATGARPWAASEPGSWAAALAVAPDGSRVIVAGYAAYAGFAGADYLTVAYDTATGARLWLRRYHGPVRRSADEAVDAAVTPDGSEVVVTGRSFGSPHNVDYATVAYDTATGGLRWVARSDHGWAEWAASLATSPDGSKVFVTGPSDAGRGHGSDYETVAYSASSGSELWAARYDGPTHSSDAAIDVGVSGDGSKVFVTGESVTDDWHVATLAYDASTGQRLWLARQYGRFSYPVALAASPDGSKVLVTGNSGGSLTVAYGASSTGATLWSSRFRQGGSARSMAMSRDGSRFFVIGDDFVTAAYDTGTGARLWAVPYDAGAYGFGRAIAVSPVAPEVFVTGASYDGTDAADVTVAYRSE
jgi:DNA-binding beta-propeller fold protein YncE